MPDLFAPEHSNDGQRKYHDAECDADADNEERLAPRVVLEHPRLLRDVHAEDPGHDAAKGQAGARGARDDIEVEEAVAYVVLTRREPPA